ncbi:hypothetical protein NDU88_004283 [Pleurodeles waltl]|uniref:Uncharacterized protein n=1 Tax=Pleurodeles waltl TaxID=8319 RepID=A0AAV7M7X9_PLEWA|nr:hypothetical protein NDU88_004283 [Pleurodeles waltl]
MDTGPPECALHWGGTPIIRDPSRLRVSRWRADRPLRIQSVSRPPPSLTRTIKPLDLRPHHNSLPPFATAPARFVVDIGKCRDKRYTPAGVASSIS